MANYNSNGHAGTHSDAPADTQEVIAELVEQAKERVRTQPAPTLAAAFGVGLVLGGGVPGFVIRLASVIAIRAVSKQLLAELASAFTGGDTPETVDVEARERAS